MNFEAIPEIINIFAKSQNVSVSKDKSHFLMKKDRIERENNQMKR